MVICCMWILLRYAVLVAFFACTRISLLADALSTGLAEETYAWGNPGAIKNIVAQARDLIVTITDEQLIWEQVY